MRKFASYLVSVEFFGHVIMLACSVGSFLHISEYLMVLMPSTMSYMFGIAIGFGLMITSIILSKIDQNDKRVYKQVLYTVIALVILSGAIQTAQLFNHGPLPIAILIGFGVPLTLELLLSLGLSSYEKLMHDRQVEYERVLAEKLKEEERQQLEENSQDKHIARTIAETYAAYDIELLKANIYSKMHFMANEVVNKTMLESLSEDAQERFKKIFVDVPMATMAPQIIESPEPKVVDAPIYKESFIKFAELLKGKFNGVATDEINKTAISKELKISRVTVNKYLEELKQADILNGHVDGTLIDEFLEEIVGV